MDKEMFNRYLNYTEQDFIADPWFCDWVLRPDKDNSEFWEAFLAEHPSKTEAVGIATLFLKALSFREDFPDEEQIQTSLANHLRQIQPLAEAPKAPVVEMPRRAKGSWLLWIAATVTGLLLATAALFFTRQKSNPQMVQTQFSQLKTVVLPDSSEVVLNANSSLQYNKNWQAGDVREVWLNGEAFFDVRHLNKDESRIKNGERFKVHSGDITVEVLGTSFDIRQRRGKTEIVLEKGKIKLSFGHSQHSDVIMQPGEMVVYDSAENSLQSTRINSENFIAWRDKKLILTDPRVSEIVHYLEDNFGYRIELKGKGLADRRIEGPILLSNLDDALFVLSTVLNTDVIKNDSTIILRAR